MAEIMLPLHYKRNFWILVADFAFFGIGITFVGTGTVIPSFLNELGAPPFVIGLMATLQSACWLLPQLLAARYLADKPYKKPHILWPIIPGRLLFLVLSISIWLTGARPPWLIITLLTVTIVGFWVADGLASVPWFDFLSKTIPPTRRGRLSGIGQIISGSAGFLVGFFVEWMLGEKGFDFPNNYAGLFFLGFLMLALSFAAIAFGVEEGGQPTRKVPSWKEFFPQLWHVLKTDRAYRRYIIMRQVYGLGSLASPFFMVFALDRLGLPSQVAGRYTSIGVVGSILAALLFAWINERLGSKCVIQISIGVNLLAPIMALLSPLLFPDPIWLAWGYGLVFLLFNASMSSMMPGWMNYVLEHAPEAERPNYVGLTNTINGVSMIFSALGGVILQWTNNNYALLFILAIIGIATALPMTLGLPEPRHAKKS
ncbi:MAG: MFS transporter [Anaerolineae bacterium]|nr:MFS transporter [Anaerolineae bacterium]